MQSRPTSLVLFQLLPLTSNFKTMKTRYIYLFFIALVFGMNSCTERIDIELDETFARLIVEGNLTNDTMAHTVYLSETSSYYYNQPAPKVSGAQVRIIDDLGNTVDLSETETGIYKTPEDYYGVIGRTYELRIDLEKEIGGSKIYEASSKLVNVEAMDSIRMEFNSKFGDDGFWIVKLYALDPSGIDNFYIFNVYKNSELMTDTLDKVSFTDDKLFDGNYTFGIGISYFNNSYDNQSFKMGDTVVLQMGGITKPHYTFLSNMSEATSFQNPLFGGPPANVVGNISGSGFGFFSAHSSTYGSLIISEKTVDFTE